MTIVALSTEPADAADELRRLMADGEPPEHRLFLVRPGPEWMADAACRDADVDYFADDAASIEAAKAVCEHCPVRLACLRFALEEGEPYGIWGGMTPEERGRTVRRRAREPGQSDLEAARAAAAARRARLVEEKAARARATLRGGRRLGA